MSKKSAANSTALSRLRQDYVRLKKDPVPYIVAEPLPSNILEWHYIVRGPENSPYEGGLYHGKLKFPPEFPFRPPSILILTPNGRFKCNTRLCLSISDFHPDTWNPAWSVGTILTGLLSFMLEKSPTLGSIETSDAEKRSLALKSLDYNLKEKIFRELFPELAKEAQETIKKRMAQLNNLKTTNSSINTTPPGSSLQQNNSNFQNIVATAVIALTFAAFAFSVQYVLKYAYEEN